MDEFDWGSLPAGTGFTQNSLVPTSSYGTGGGMFGNSSNMTGWGMPQQQQPTSFWGKDGFNVGSVGTIVSGLGALANAWAQFQNLKVAKGQLNLARDGFELNARNSIQSYNTSLEDRIRGRTADYAGKEGDVQSYLAKHSLHR